MAGAAGGRGSSKMVAEGLFGLIQGVMLVPVSISFATIIFRDPFFGNHMPMLIKLVVFSCTVHQVVFTTRSTLPFAVGQVQDAGLIFLSAMASDIVFHCKHHGADDYETIATVLVALSLSTFALGLMLVLIGSLKLASLVQYLPMPVVGGYLAYIGFFCGEAGLALMAGVEIVSITDWYKLADAQALRFIFPGLVLALALYTTMRRVRHMLTMPVFLLTVLLLFYLLLLVTGTSLEEAREQGWVAPRTAMAPCYRGWEYLELSKVQWKVIPTQVLSWVGMVLVVAFSSSLDVAAIEMEIGKPLDYDKELTTVGISNTLSGLTGGYTGSYIFSQTIFNLRAKVESRLTGWVIIILEAGIFAMPFSPIAYVPKAFFGSLLLLIAIDLNIEWLWGARTKLERTEYGVNLLTFLSCLAFGVEKGIVLGLVLAMTAFTMSYARVPAITMTPASQTTVVRTFEERRLLQRMHHQVLVMSMHGYIFFASSVRLLNEAKAALHDHQHRHTFSSSSSSSSLSSSSSSSSASASVPSSKQFLNVSSSAASNPVTVPSYTSPNGSPASTSSISPPINVPPPPSSISSSSFPLPSSERPHDEGNAWGMEVGFSPVNSRAGRLFSSSPEKRRLLYAPVREGEAEEERPKRREGEERARGGGRAVEGGRGRRRGLGRVDEEGDLDEEEGEGGRLAVRARAGGLEMRQASERTPLVHMEGGKSRRIVMADEKGEEEGGGIGIGGGIGGGGVRVDGLHGAEDAVKFVILDFSQVTGLDASSARACFLMLRQLLRNCHIRCVFVFGREGVRGLLRAHEVLSEDEDRCFSSLADAVEWCEEELLASAPTICEDMARHPSYYRRAQASRHGQRLAKAQMAPLDPLVAMLEDYLQVPEHRTSPFVDPDIRAALGEFFTQLRFDAGAVLYEPGQDRTFLYFIESGSVDVLALAPPSTSKASPSSSSSPSPSPSPSSSSSSSSSTAASAAALLPSSSSSSSPSSSMPPSPSSKNAEFIRVQRISSGGVCGELGFFLNGPEAYRVQAARAAVCWCLARPDFERMQSTHPQLCILVQRALIKSIALSDSEFLEAQSLASASMASSK